MTNWQYRALQGVYF